jgi:hypothetical protein
VNWQSSCGGSDKISGRAAPAALRSSGRVAPATLISNSRAAPAALIRVARRQDLLDKRGSAAPAALTRSAAEQPSTGCPDKIGRTVVLTSGVAEQPSTGYPDKSGGAAPAALIRLFRRAPVNPELLR